MNILWYDDAYLHINNANFCCKSKTGRDGLDSDVVRSRLLGSSGCADYLHVGIV